MSQGNLHAEILAAAARVEAIGLRACTLEEAGLHWQALAGYRDATEASRRLVRLCRAAVRQGLVVPQELEPNVLLRVSLGNVARALEALGQYSEALQIRRRLLREARRVTASSGGTTAADELADAAVAYSWVLGKAGRGDAALRVLRKAVRSAETLSPAIRARLDEMLALQFDRQGRWAEGLVHWQSAALLNAGDQTVRAHIATMIMHSRAILGHPERSYDHQRDDVAQADPNRAAPSAGVAAVESALALGQHARQRDRDGDAAGAEAAFEDAIAQWDRVARKRFAGARMYAAALRVELGLMIGAAGRHAEALVHLDRARESLARARQSGLTARFDWELIATCASLALRQRQRDGLARGLSAVDALADEAGVAHLEVSLGDQAAIGVFLATGTLCRQLDWLWDRWTNGPVISRAARNAYRLWLALALRVLGECSPQLLVSHGESIRRDVEDVLRWRLKLGGTDLAADVARWVLHTQGLRAQRDFLVVSADADVKALADLWRQIDDLDRDALARSAGLGPGNISQRRELAQRRDALRQSLVEQGRLPAVLAPDLEALAAGLREGEQLWMLVPIAAPPRLLVVTVQARRDLPVEDSLQLHIVPLQPQEGTGSWMEQLDAICAALGHRARGPLRGRVQCRPAPLESVVSTEPAASWAGLEKSAKDVVQAMLAMPLAQGLQGVDIVAVGDTQALPWANLLHDALHEPRAAATRVRQHASMSAWFLARSARRPTDPPLLAASAPAIAFDDGSSAAGSQALPLVWLEAELSWRLWNDRLGVTPALLPDLSEPGQMPCWPPTLPAGRVVSSLIGIGHGRAPEGNWARAGLWMPGWPSTTGQGAGDAHLDVACLPGIPHVRRVFMSCCILGRTEERLGEPLGFVALAAGVGVEAAMGSLVPVDDAQALLLSLAFQWKVTKPSGSADWIDGFQELRTELRQGRWPDRFQTWLHAQLGAKLAAEKKRRADGPRSTAIQALLKAGAERPTPSLAQACDWFVALGG